MQDAGLAALTGTTVGLLGALMMFGGTFAIFGGLVVFVVGAIIHNFLNKDDGDGDAGGDAGGENGGEDSDNPYRAHLSAG